MDGRPTPPDRGVSIGDRRVQRRHGSPHCGLRAHLQRDCGLLHRGRRLLRTGCLRVIDRQTISRRRPRPHRPRPRALALADDVDNRSCRVLNGERDVHAPADAGWASDPLRETQRFEVTRAALRDAVSGSNGRAEPWWRRTLRALTASWRGNDGTAVMDVVVIASMLAAVLGGIVAAIRIEDHLPR